MANLTFQTTSVALSVMDRLLSSNIHADGIENLSERPTIFVINHFTRAETFLVPYVIYKYTHNYVHSLADSSLFKGALKDYFRQMGVVSTRAKDRDDRIVGDLITGRRNWVIYPEGSMVKTKKLIKRGRFLIKTPKREGPPHRGAAVLAMKAEIHRQRLHRALAAGDDREVAAAMKQFSLAGPGDVAAEGVALQPVTITYYPLRPGSNILKRLVRRFFKDLPAQLEEELEIEGNLLLRDTDIDIHFAAAVPVADYLDPFIFVNRRIFPILGSLDRSNLVLRHQGRKLTREVMTTIYSNSQINLDHLVCAGLRQLSRPAITDGDLRRYVYLAATTLRSDGKHRMHPQLADGLVGALTGGCLPLDSILRLGNELGIIETEDGRHQLDHQRLDQSHAFHNVRLANPMAVIANELEPMQNVQRRLAELIALPTETLRQRTADLIFAEDCARFEREYDEWFTADDSVPRESGRPFFLQSKPGSPAVVLAHGFTASPAEVRPLGDYLHALGYTVYGLRLPGHGTAPQHLAQTHWQEWVDAFCRGYAAVRQLSNRIVFGGFSTGGLPALIHAADAAWDVKGVFAVASPIRLKYIKAQMAPAVHFWNELTEHLPMKGRRLEYVDTLPEDPNTNYRRVYVPSLIQLERLMAGCAHKLRKIELPTLILHARHDPTVDPRSADRLCAGLRNADVRSERLDFDRHVIVRGRRSEEVFERIAAFVNGLQSHSARLRLQGKARTSSTPPAA